MDLHWRFPNEISIGCPYMDVHWTPSSGPCVPKMDVKYMSIVNLYLIGNYFCDY